MIGFILCVGLGFILAVGAFYAVGHWKPEWILAIMLKPKSQAPPMPPVAKV